MYHNRVAAMHDCYTNVWSLVDGKLLFTIPRNVLSDGVSRMVVMNAEKLLIASDHGGYLYDFGCEPSDTKPWTIEDFREMLGLPREETSA